MGRQPALPSRGVVRSPAISCSSAASPASQRRLVVREALERRQNPAAVQADRCAWIDIVLAECAAHDSHGPA